MCVLNNKICVRSLSVFNVGATNCYYYKTYNLSRESADFNLLYLESYLISLSNIDITLL